MLSKNVLSTLDRSREGFRHRQRCGNSRFKPEAAISRQGAAANPCQQSFITACRLMTQIPDNAG